MLEDNRGVIVQEQKQAKKKQEKKKTRGIHEITLNSANALN
jgi:hypothetical protein